MNKILVIITIFMSNVCSAQNNANIIGLYSLGSSSPEGGSHLFILENGKYAITYFGGIQIGQWELTQDDVFKFTPDVKQSEFELYGRHNNDLQDSIKIFFNGFEEGQTFVHLGAGAEQNKERIIRRVFNTGANCFSFPYVYMFKTVANRISFMSIEEDIVTFGNEEGYNDFVAFFFKKDKEVRPFLVTLKEDKLYFNDNDFSSRSPLPKQGEDIEFIRDLTSQDMNTDNIYYNPSYNRFVEDINEYHVFNEQKRAFIDPEEYIEGEEYNESEDLYENMSIIYSFKRLKSYPSESSKYKIDETPLYHITCD